MSQNNKWGALSMKDRAFLIREAVRKGVTDIGIIKDTWEHRFDGLQDIVNKVNTSKKDFAKRLRQEGRASIPDWEDPRRIATHKLGVATDENGIHYIFPSVQNINGQLVDFTNPKTKGHGYEDVIAAERGDTIQIGNTNRDLRNAIKFTERYKKLGIYPEFSAPPHTFDGESNQPTEEMPWYKKLASAISEGSRMARDARIGAIGAEQIRELYNEGKTEEAQELAKQYAKANIAGMAMAAGAANTAGLVGDLAITGVSTLADTAVEGNFKNSGKDFLKNAAADLIGYGIGKAINKAFTKVIPVLKKPKVEAEMLTEFTPNEAIIKQYNFREGPDNTRMKPAPEYISSKSTLDFYKSGLYRRQLKNKYPELSDTEIDEIIKQYEHNLANTHAWRGVIKDKGIYEHSATMVGDTPVLTRGDVYIGPLSDDQIPLRVWDKRTAEHEFIHASTGGGRWMPEPLNNDDVRNMAIEALKARTKDGPITSLITNEGIDKKMTEYIISPDELRTRLLLLLKETEGDLDAIRFYRSKVAKNRLVLTKLDVAQLFDLFTDEQLSKMLEKVVAIGAPVGIGAAVSAGPTTQFTEKENQKDSHIFSGEEDSYNILTDIKAALKRSNHKKSLENFVRNNPTLYGLNTADYVDFLSELAGLEGSYNHLAGEGMNYSGYYGLKGGRDLSKDDQHKKAYEHISKIFKENMVKEDLEKGKELGYTPAQILAKYWNQGNRVTNYLHNNEDSTDGLGTKVSEYGKNMKSSVDYSGRLKSAITDDYVLVKNAKTLADGIKRARNNYVNYLDRDSSILNLNTEVLRHKAKAKAKTSEEKAKADSVLFDPTKLKVKDTIWLNKPEYLKVRTPNNENYDSSSFSIMEHEAPFESVTYETFQRIQNKQKKNKK